jgi:IS30 family transposase
MARLNYDDILYIYKLISIDYSALEISKELNVNPSTIYRLLKENRYIRQIGKSFRSYKFKNCIHMNQCRKTIKACPSDCDRYVKKVCPLLQSFPFICNFCIKRKGCVKEQYIFNPDQVYKERQERLRESRRSIKISSKELKTFNQWFSPLIKNGIGIETLYHSYPDEFPASTSTVRRWINHGHLSVRRIDLRRAVKYRVKKQYSRKRPYLYDPLVKYGHTHSFFLEHIKTIPEPSIMEFDTVHGQKSDKAKLLTMYHRQSHFQIGILIKDNHALTVKKALLNMQVLLGDDFPKIFEIILADNGFEFDELMNASISKDTGEVLSHVYYAKPYCSGDKGGCERNHEFFRYFIPKGKSIQNLTQSDVDIMFSQINSYPRKSLNWQCPIDLFKKKFSARVINKLNYQKVDVSNINFKIKNT